MNVPPLCTVAGYRYRSERLRLAPGACLCVVTDGVTEALDERGELYGAARVEAILKGLTPENAPGAVLETLRGDVKRFAGNAPLADDVTLVALRWRGAT